MVGLARPELYFEGEDGSLHLAGVRCSCGRVAFPFQPFGCERCGSVTGLQPADLRASGTLAAAITVHIHPGAMPPAPFRLGAVRLDDGPMVRARLQGDGLKPGDRVAGALFPVGEAADAVFDLRFVPAGGGEAAAHG